MLSLAGGGWVSPLATSIHRQAERSAGGIRALNPCVELRRVMLCSQLPHRQVFTCTLAPAAAPAAVVALHIRWGPVWFSAADSGTVISAGLSALGHTFLRQLLRVWTLEGSLQCLRCKGGLRVFLAAHAACLAVQLALHRPASSKRGVHLSAGAAW